MKYSAAVLAFAGAVMAHGGHEEEAAQSTVFSTKYFTITSCAPEVTNCPARSTVVSSSVVPVITNSAELPVLTTTAVPVPVTTPAAVYPIPSAPAPAPPAGNGTVPVPPVKPTTETGVKPVPVTTGAAVPSVSKPATLVSQPAPVCPGSPVKTISTSITTVIPTVIYETVQIPCPTPSAPSATIPGVPTGGNGTAVPPTKTPVTAGASGLSGSVVLAAVAGVAAYVFA
ncbi:hypothetical protein Cob_v003220 [Colletotrichum orbiculare MAFF 240422]|uniref:Uncharacterized protein n=1 Tax=Colletotrichum orbiculare (strain 104-T / ATCC 96160 / CBS 514.97 / LARS 414 / MAFF 240422) TaxID=1213857 RepID=N4VA16_COLOR|nr:hypothetical protein Cob_v003220 [Colletotrichum orbiculare MAFF 240422]